VTLREVVNWYDFSGKTAIVTGGTGALGSEIAFALAACGANVAILARTPERPAQLNDLNDEAGRVIALHADVLDRASLEAAAADILREFGTINLLVNAAGGNHPQATATPDLSFFDLPADALEFVFELNMLGTILPSQVFGRYMADQEAGVILNFSSMTSVRPLTRVVGYGAAKAGVNNFTQWLAVYMAQNVGPQVRVNALAPGFFIGKQNRALLLNDDDSLTERGQTIIDHTPMSRFGEPGELVGAALWLLSPASAFVTGIIVPVDGGFSAFSGV
jgi:NAD(P)-dependent dehydrogenase (short-subunit alcohol dehydrogenase family)